MKENGFVRQDLLELASAYADYSVLVTTAQMDLPGPQILYANSAFTRMTGYAVHELLGKTPRILQGPQTDRPLLKRLRSTLDEGHDFIARAINYKRDGTPFELEWIISHLRDAEGQTTHYVALQRDISGMERAEQDLIKFDDELRDASHNLIETVHKLEVAENRLFDRERFAVLGEMAAGVVHDISNALTPVFSLVELLHTVENLPLGAQKLTSSLDHSIEHALQVLSNLKEYYQKGHTRSLEPVDLQQLLHQIPDNTKARWWSVNRQPGRGINFAFDISHPVSVSGNETELTQVLTNLVYNAIDAMPEGGTLSLSLSAEDSDAVLSITDTGTGMSAEMAERCFYPYVTTRDHGTGLGLSVCRRIVEQHRGTIMAYSEESKGTSFVIRLPLLSPINTPASSHMRSAPMRVLHVSSDSLEQSESVRILQAMGLIVDTATSGDEGLACFYKAKYDLVIAGAQMRPTSGFDVAQSIKRSSPEIPIAVCADADHTLSAESLPEHLRPDAIITTPLASQDIETILNRLGLWKNSD